MNSVVHFEVVADDPQRAKKFYGSVFDWKFNETGAEYGNYIIALTADTDENGMNKTPGTINGGIAGKTAETKNTIIVVDIKNTDESIKKVEVAGGKVIEGPMDIPGIGKYTRVRDTEGNIVGMMESLSR